MGLNAMMTTEGQGGEEEEQMAPQERIGKGKESCGLRMHSQGEAERYAQVRPSSWEEEERGGSAHLPPYLVV